MKPEIVEFKNKYYIRLGSVIPSWQNGFECIEAAKHFIKKHKNLSAEKAGMSREDIQFLIDTYGFKQNPEMLELRTGNQFITLKPYMNRVQMNVQDSRSSSAYEYESIDDLTAELDKVIEATQVIASSKVQTVAFIFAASSREIAKNMVRVKSSNVWSYTLDVKSNKDNTGTLYIQYKNKNGGPGDVYCYYNVPIKLWRRFISAPSKGNFVWRFIRNTFLYSKLTGDKRTHLKNGISAQRAQAMENQEAERR